MAIKPKSAAAVAEVLAANAPVAAAVQPAAPETTTAPTVVASVKPRTITNEIRGQVRMHAIKEGYRDASALAATLADEPSKVKTVLHELAAEIAAKIEAYTFQGD